MAPIEGRNVRTNTMFSAILTVLFAIKIMFFCFSINMQVGFVYVYDVFSFT